MPQAAMTSRGVDEFLRDIEETEGELEHELSAALELCRPVILEAINQNFRTGSTAGRAWPPRKDEGFGHPLLVKTGELMAAAGQTGAPGHIDRLVSDEDGKALEIGVEATGNGSLAGAAVHNFGATIRPVEKQYLSWVDSGGVRHFAKQVTIPQREYMAIGDDAVEECGETMADAMLNRVAM